MMLKVKRVKQLMKAKGLTNVWVSNICGVVPGSVSQWFCGARKPGSRLQIEALAKGLGVDVTDIWEGPLPGPVPPPEAKQAAG